MGCCCGTSAVDDEAEQRQLVQDEPDDDARDVDAGLEGLNVVNVQLPTVYYVIVGRGPMAVVNHRTLRASAWGRDRIGELPVLHVGFPNPWPRYLRHGLGQPNHLLSFPAFANQPSIGGGAIDGGLDSQHFGGQISAEFDTLDAQVAEEWVGLIQSQAGMQAIDDRIAAEIGGGAVRDAINLRIQAPWPAFEDGEAPYRLCLYNPVNGTARLVYAAKIDICTGPGRPSVFAPANGDSDETRAARTPPWLSPERWSQQPVWRNRRTLNGVDAIRDEVVWNNGDRVCVTAGGGVGLNAAEKARNNQCVLDWFGRDELMPIFENPRNITFLREPNTNDHRAPARRLDAGINGEDDLIASSRRARMGRGARLAAVANTDVAVEVRLAAAGNEHIIRDWWGNHSQLNVGEGRWELSQDYAGEVGGLGVAESRVYRRLVIPNGQATNEVGHPRSFAHHLAFQAVEEAGRLVALETADHLVRLLGAACNNYPGYGIGTRNVHGNTPKDRMWNFHATLPVSAVPDGFILCGVNTALANHYFDDHPNRNVNTMTPIELAGVVGDDLAARIIAERNTRNGYSSLQELRAACDNDQDARLAQLQFAYPVAG
ncbi:hypothetical protein WMF45_06910 [Sorangium sp. So ce448]|uniref:hypothetical protein n=1 Tax=Sorangium sp. So ce448 TaxID=3133314 RepID=UPI003F613D2A